jgi:GT2 family glycosyltransferase
VTGEVVPLSVVIPTMGRRELLGRCLASITACRPRAEEVLVVDQSHSPEVAELVRSFAPLGARLVPCPGRGVSRGRNLGLRKAAHVVVLVTDDDCTVAGDWVATAWTAMSSDPERIVVGPVYGVGDPLAVPSTRDLTAVRDFTGRMRIDLLSPNNMVLNRPLALALGGFDERFGPREKAEDNDFCYRWLKAGHRMHFEPTLVVWHHGWRTKEQLPRLYIDYMRGVGFLYAKHLREGDLRVLKFLGFTLIAMVRSFAAAVVKRRASWADPRRGIVRGLPVGLWRGFRVYWLGAQLEQEPSPPDSLEKSSA